jgi:predicted DNA-binding transcriptional regulator AlpA
MEPGLHCLTDVARAGEKETLPLSALGELARTLTVLGHNARPVGPDPLLLPRAEAAHICGGLSKATWARLNSAGKIPRPVRLGGRVLWRLEELRDWVRAGCPDRQRWELFRANKQD